MLWTTLWFLVILKIPLLYLAYVIWWAVRDQPAANGGSAGGGADEADGGPWNRGLRVNRPSARRGPHGSPARRFPPRRPLRTLSAQAGASEETAS